MTQHIILELLSFIFRWWQKYQDVENVFIFLSKSSDNMFTALSLSPIRQCTWASSYYIQNMDLLCTSSIKHGTTVLNSSPFDKMAAIYIFFIWTGPELNCHCVLVPQHLNMFSRQNDYYIVIEIYWQDPKNIKTFWVLINALLATLAFGCSNFAWCIQPLIVLLFFLHHPSFAC